MNAVVRQRLLDNAIIDEAAAVDSARGTDNEPGDKDPV